MSALARYHSSAQNHGEWHKLSPRKRYYRAEVPHTGSCHDASHLLRSVCRYQEMLHSPIYITSRAAAPMKWPSIADMGLKMPLKCQQLFSRQKLAAARDLMHGFQALSDATAHHERWEYAGLIHRFRFAIHISFCLFHYIVIFFILSRRRPSCRASTRTLGCSQY